MSPNFTVVTSWFYLQNVLLGQRLQFAILQLSDDTLINDVFRQWIIGKLLALMGSYPIFYWNKNNQDFTPLNTDAFPTYFIFTGVLPHFYWWYTPKYGNIWLFLVQTLKHSFVYIRRESFLKRSSGILPLNIKLFRILCYCNCPNK